MTAPDPTSCPLCAGLQFKHKAGCKLQPYQDALIRTTVTTALNRVTALLLQFELYSDQRGIGL